MSNLIVVLSWSRSRPLAVRFVSLCLSKVARHVCSTQHPRFPYANILFWRKKNHPPILERKPRRPTWALLQFSIVEHGDYRKGKYSISHFYLSAIFYFQLYKKEKKRKEGRKEERNDGKSNTRDIRWRKRGRREDSRRAESKKKKTKRLGSRTYT